MSTSIGQPNPAPYWKQEVNRRLAAHKSRRGPFTAGLQTPAEVHLATGSRAAQAAARVAARYAQAPSYSQMLAAEARTAVRAAEIATQVALEAQANARAALAGYENAKSRREMDLPPNRMTLPAPRPEPIPAPVSAPIDQPISWVREPQPLEFDPVPEMHRAHETHSRQLRAVDDPQPLQADAFAIPAEEWWRTAVTHRDPAEGDDREHPELGPVEPETPELPSHANLIEFPREVASARKAHARHPDGIWAFHGDLDSQLSIFEVDPGTVTIPAEAEEAPEPVPAQPTAFEWSGIELDAQPGDDLPEEVVEPAPVAALELAPLSRRVMAAVVDATLITGGLLGAALVAAVNVNQLPAAKFLEMGAAAALFLAALLYHALFFTLAEATPGMKYARISLCTFDDQSPSRAQLRARLGALLLSVMPLGIGVMWAIFDEDHLSWHDRLSKTYQRRCAL